MINLALSRANHVVSTENSSALQEYVHALLARQQALDMLESIHFQINQVCSTVRRMLAGSGKAARAAQAVRVALAAQAALAQTSYRALEKRREECIAALQQAERRAHAALKNTVKPSVPANGNNSPARSSTRNRSDVVILKPPIPAAC